MAGRFEVYKDAGGKYRFRLKAPNGEVLASGQGYSSAKSAKRACEQILLVAEGAPIVEVQK